MTISNQITHIHQKGLFDLSFILCSNVLQICLSLLNDVCMLYSTPLSVYIYFFGIDVVFVVDEYDENNKDHLSFFPSFAFRVIKYAFCRLFAERERESNDPL